MITTFYKRIDKVLEKTRIIKKRFVNIKDEFVKPDSFYKGENFENYVEEFLFPEDKYTLIRRTDTFERNRKRFSESTNDPDLLFRCMQTQREFAVEAKYRTSLRNGQLSWCKMYQMERYKEIDRIRYPVFVAVGLQGTSIKPEEIFLFPVRKVKYINLNMDIALRYKLKTAYVKNDGLWSLL